MEVLTTSLPGLLRLRPDVFRDARGYFMEPWNEARYRAAGIGVRFVMDGESYSKKGTVRGLHFREPPESKLVRCIMGRIFDVAVDLRPDSPTFGRWEGFELSAENHEQLFIPAGFAHGFSVLSEESLMLYKKTELFDAKLERGVRFDDPEIGVDWRVEITTVSERDRSNPSFLELFAGSGIG
ncbi:MAG: dTDP-4-dehydrorhamnose 3,5-epimerase [Deltaproteobacteria bacterium]|nr:dTDP-4-dehydrorhamnose 3,5-epimerase [Deltaproteobacteria bacterium]